MPPIYSFMCDSCGHEFDDVAAFDPENKPVECPHMCGDTATRIPSAAQYRGSFGTSSTPKRRGAVGKQVEFNFRKKVD